MYRLWCSEWDLVRTTDHTYPICTGPSAALAQEDVVEGEEDDDDLEVADEDDQESEEPVSIPDRGEEEEDDDDEVCVCVCVCVSVSVCESFVQLSFIGVPTRKGISSDQSMVVVVTNTIYLVGVAMSHHWSMSHPWSSQVCMCVSVSSVYSIEHGEVSYLRKSMGICYCLAEASSQTVFMVHFFPPCRMKEL